MNHTHEAVNKVVERFLQAYARHDVDACMALIAKDRPLLFFGTEADEVFRTPQELISAFQRDFVNLADIKWGEVRHMELVVDAHFASVLIELPISFMASDKRKQLLFRYAFTLHQEDDEWRLIQGLASTPMTATSQQFSSWD